MFSQSIQNISFASVHDDVQTLQWQNIVSTDQFKPLNHSLNQC